MLGTACKLAFRLFNPATPIGFVLVDLPAGAWYEVREFDRDNPFLDALKPVGIAKRLKLKLSCSLFLCTE